LDILSNRTYLENSKSRPRARREPIRHRPKKRAMAGQAQKRSPPHILADEHFNPPAADYRALDAF